MALKRKAYDELIEPMQAELVAMARWAAATGQRICILFEGRDTAGKGGAIGAIADKLNPRQCRIVALPKPSEVEKGQWYFQRYACHLPGKGEITLFDRSWYNRAGVEKVMGFATPEQVADFLEAAPMFERQLVDDGILLFKYWLTTDQAEQEKRFAERLDGPAQAVEAVADRSGGAGQICRLHQGARGDAEGDPHANGRRGPWSISTTRSAAG